MAVIRCYTENLWRKMSHENICDCDEALLFVSNNAQFNALLLHQKWERKKKLVAKTTLFSYIQKIPKNLRTIWWKSYEEEEVVL